MLLGRRAFCGGLLSLSQIPGASAFPQPPTRAGIASWYGPRFHGRQTASGARYNMHAMTAASPWIKLGSVVKIYYRDRLVIVTINDRMPVSSRRDFDLSKAAAQRLGMIESGVAKIKWSFL